MAGAPLAGTGLDTLKLYIEYNDFIKSADLVSSVPQIEADFTVKTMCRGGMHSVYDLAHAFHRATTYDPTRLPMLARSKA
jgi:hypothetical protein